VVFNDADGNGAMDGGEMPLADWTVHLDLNQNSVIHAGELTAVTGLDGAYAFSLPELPTNALYNVQAILPAGEATGRYLNTTEKYDFVTVPANTNPDLTLDFGFSFVPYSTYAPQGGETLVNQTTAGQQGGQVDPGYISDHAQSIASDSAGNYVVAWGTKTASGQHQVFARIYNADGSARTAEFKVADSTLPSSAAVARPLVTMSRDGSRFAVAWDNFQTTKGGSPFDPAGTHAPFMRVYSSSGAAVTAAVQVVAYNKNANFRASGLGMDADGDLVVMMTDVGKGISQMQRYTRQGAAVGKVVQVAAANLQDGGRAMATDAAGNFVVAWVNLEGIYAQRFSSTGAKVGSQITVATDNSATGFIDNNYVAVAMNDSGRFVVTWNTQAVNGERDNVAQAFNAAGQPSGGRATIGSSVFRAAATMDAAGDATFAWTAKRARNQGTLGTDSATEILVRRLSAAGDLSETQVVNDTTQGSQFAPSVAAHANGFIVSWSGRGAGDDQGVFAQRFTLDVPAPSALASGLDAALLGYLMSLETDDDDEPLEAIFGQ
jgi:hypothetical protein